MERYNGSVEGYDNVVWPKGTPDSEIEASVATMERQRLKHKAWRERDQKWFGWMCGPDLSLLSDEERRHQETLQAIKNNRGGFLGFGFVGSVVIVLWALGLYH